MEQKKIFISWSKKTSKEIAEKLLDFLTHFFSDPNVKFFLSTEMDGGIRPMHIIGKNLEKSHFGVLVLTKMNYKSEWIMFEAGAISKDVDKSRIIPILFNRDSNNIEKPIRSFQYVKFNKDGFLKLVSSIRKAIFDQTSLTDIQKEDIKEKLEKYWTHFNTEIVNILKNAEINNIDEFKEKVPELMMNENAYEKVLAKRDTHLQELIENLHKDNSKRIIILGGISTTLRADSSIRAFAKWLIDNPNSKLFICYENIEVVKHRAKDLRIGVYNNTKENDAEAIRRKVKKFNEMRNNLLATVAERFKANIHFIEIVKPLSVYVTIQETTMYLTPVLDKRSSNTFTFKLKQTKLIEDVLDYMCLKINKHNSNSTDLLKEIEKIKKGN